VYRTADEAVYDEIIRSAIPYEAPISWDTLKEGDMEKIEQKEICASCFSPLVPYSEYFTMDAGYGCIFIVSYNSGICKKCFESLQANQKKYRPVQRVKINYAFGSEALQTIEAI